MGFISKVEKKQLQVKGKYVRPSQKLLDAVLEEIERQVGMQDWTAIDELLSYAPKKALIEFMPDEEQWDKYRKMGKQKLLDTVQEEIQKDIDKGDVTCIEELLTHLDKEYLIGFLDEEEGDKYK